MGMADPHQRTKDQVLYDHEYNELLLQSTRMHNYSAREHRRWILKRLGPRPGGGMGLNTEPGRRL